MVAFAGEFGGEAGGGGNGGDDRDAAGEGFLHDLERGAAADQQDVFAEGQFFVEEGPAEDFVDGVVTADIFAECEQVAGKVEERGGVNATGFGEGGLRGNEFFGECWRIAGSNRGVD